MIAELEIVLTRARALAADDCEFPWRPRNNPRRGVVAPHCSSYLYPASARRINQHRRGRRPAGLSPSYLYRNHQQFPFTRRVGRSLRFSSQGLQNYIANASEQALIRH